MLHTVASKTLGIVEQLFQLKEFFSQLRVSAEA